MVDDKLEEDYHQISTRETIINLTWILYHGSDNFEQEQNKWKHLQLKKFMVSMRCHIEKKNKTKFKLQAEISINIKMNTDSGRYSWYQHPYIILIVTEKVAFQK